MYKTYKIKLMPTKEQENLIWKHIDACRFVWNFMLENENKSKKYLNNFSMTKMLPNLKEQNKWLKEVSAYSLVLTCKDLDKSFNLFFKKTNRRPKFKIKGKSSNSYPIRGQNNKFYFLNNFVKIEKLGKIKINKNLLYLNDNKKINPRISYINNKWILSFSVEYNDNKIVNNEDKIMGIDLGIKEFAVVAYENEKIVFHNINKTKNVKNLEHKLKYIKKTISRKYRVNGNYEKTNSIIKYEKIQNEIYYKLHNIRKNYINQVINQLISLHPSKIVIEDLNVRGMTKNKYLSDSINKQCFYEFQKCLEYKCKWNGIEFVKADRFYPSSKLCSRCGNKKIDLKLSDRIYKCGKCGLIIDRDYNAAINLMNYVV